MMKKSQIIISSRKLLIYSLLPLIIIGTALPSLLDFSNPEMNTWNRKVTYDKDSFSFGFSKDDNFVIPQKVDVQNVEDPEAFFPNFLYYSIEIANVLIDYLYDNVSGGFYTSTDEFWSETRINDEKQTYVNAQAILALVKLSDAVINETERIFALEIAEETGNYLLDDLYDHMYEGFLSSGSNRYKKPGIQAKAIQAFLTLSQKLNNETYLDIALDTFQFLADNAWQSVDEKNGYFVYILSDSGIIEDSNPNIYDPYEPQSKRVDHNALMGSALLDLYRSESQEKYLTYAKNIFNFFNSTCRNKSTGLFYTGLNGDNEIVEPTSSDLFINSVVLDLLAQLYNVTGDIKYYNDFFFLLYDLMTNFWDNQYGGFYATYSYIDSSPVDLKKYTERQFYAIRAFDEAYKLSNNSVFYNIILDVFEFLNEKLYDNHYGGYFQLTNNDGISGDPSWNNKFTVTQSLSIYALANLWMYSKPGVLNAYWSPSTPLANKDSVNILVAAFDSDGISNVILNYSVNEESYIIKEMSGHPIIGNMFNFTLESQKDDTTVTFYIIVNDTLGKQVVRGSYSFFWQYDTWSPNILEIGFDPAIEVPVNEEFTVTVSVQDVPSQGIVSHVRMYYHLPGKSEESVPLTQIATVPQFWTTTFEGSLPPGTYGYYFEAIDNRGNYEHSPTSYFYIIGELETFPLAIIVGAVFIIFFAIPAGLYTYVEYKKKSARKIIKNNRETRYQRQRGRKRMCRAGRTVSSRGKRGTKRAKSTMETQK